MEYSPLHGQYHVEKTIGCGGFAKVKLATHILTGEKVAIKIMQKQTLLEDLPRVRHEINALKSLSHTNICKLYQVVETSTHYYLVMEYCCGGELFDHIVDKEKLTEDEARLFFKQIVSAVSYLHSQGFAHRDIKPENILLDKKHNLKLIDFGLSVKPENGLESSLYTSCGSPNYAAPELIRGEQYLGHEVDIWSLGVLLYALLCGCLPFDDPSIQKLYGKILSGYYEEKWWLSSESKSLLNSLLQVNARKRISTDRLKAHPWFRKGSEKTDVGHSVPRLLKDDIILKMMAKYFNMTPEELWKEIEKEKFDYIMATYLLLLDKKKNNEPVKLITDMPSPKKKILVNSLKQAEKSKDCPVNHSAHSPLRRTGTYILKNRREGTKTLTQQDENCSSGRRKCKRIRSPGLEEKAGPEAKRIRSVKTPDIGEHKAQSELTPSGKKILVGLERSLNKARLALTPRRNNSSTENSQPAILWGKDLCNVSSTASKSPNKILAQLQNALNAKGIICTQKGFVLKGKLRKQSNEKRKGKDQEDKLSFELEVCWIPPPTASQMQSVSKKTTDPLEGAVVGIRRKRLRGDAWIYKNICEEVLALAAPLK